MFSKYPATCGRPNTIGKHYMRTQIFLNMEKKSPFSKIPGYMWTGPKTTQPCDTKQRLCFCSQTSDLIRFTVQSSCNSMVYVLVLVLSLLVQ